LALLTAGQRPGPRHHAERLGWQELPPTHIWITHESLARRVSAIDAQVSGASSVPLSAVCHRSDFELLADWFNRIFTWGREVFGPEYPIGVEYRKHWEVVQAARTMAVSGVLDGHSEILGVGAGNEPTIFWLTNHVGRVFATDLYLRPGWEESANAGMLLDPGRSWSGDWNPRRLVVQHMDALDLQYEDASFDGVFSSSSIEHFGGHDEVRHTVQEVHRVLKPGGVFSVSTEILLAGSGPGLPGVLMFTWDQLFDLILSAAEWDMMGPVRKSPPESEVPIVSFAEAVEALEDHVDKHSEIVWSELDWPQYPHIVLEHEGLVWTSVHLALQKPV